MEWGLRIKKLKFWGFTEKSDFKEGGGEGVVHETTNI